MRSIGLNPTRNELDNMIKLVNMNYSTRNIIIRFWTLSEIDTDLHPPSIDEQPATEPVKDDSKKSTKKVKEKKPKIDFAEFLAFLSRQNITEDTNLEVFLIKGKY